MSDNYKKLLLECFLKGVDACLPENCLPDFLPQLNDVDRICILGAGKAAAQMAVVVNAHYPGKCYGTVVTRYGHSKDTDVGAIKVLEAGHPVPDLNSLAAAEAILAEARAVPAETPVFVLLSGGGSALMSMPAPGISYEEKMAVHAFLLKSGASIDEINCVRTHLSSVKGGGLARMVSSNYLETFIISDVVGDDPSVIASGPTIQNATSPYDALCILRKYGWAPIPAVEAVLEQGGECSASASNKSGIHIVASARTMLEAAANHAGKLGWAVEIFAEDETGEASIVAGKHAEIACKAKETGRRAILLSGGELTVSLGKNSARGGPSQEYLLALAKALQGEAGIYALACDSDGIDGSEDNAGAFMSPDTIRRAVHQGISIEDSLDNHDSYSFFSALNDLVITGPTGTNVNDFRVLLIDP